MVKGRRRGEKRARGLGRPPILPLLLPGNDVAVASEPSCSFGLPNNNTQQAPDRFCCHSCGHPFPSDEDGGDHIVHLRSQWRVVLLCGVCLHRVKSAALCSYCFSPITDVERSLSCLRCSRQIHLRCGVIEHRCIGPWRLVPGSFTCIDCCAIQKRCGRNLVEETRICPDNAVMEARIVAEKADTDSKKSIDDNLTALIDDQGSCTGKDVKTHGEDAEIDCIASDCEGKKDRVSVLLYPSRYRRDGKAKSESLQEDDTPIPDKYLIKYSRRRSKNPYVPFIIKLTHLAYRTSSAASIRLNWSATQKQLPVITAVAVEFDGNGAAGETRARGWSCTAAAEVVGDSAVAMVGIRDGPAATAVAESDRNGGSAQLEGTCTTVVDEGVRRKGADEHGSVAAAGRSGMKETKCGKEESGWEHKMRRTAGCEKPHGIRAAIRGGGRRKEGSRLFFPPHSPILHVYERRKHRVPVLPQHCQENSPSQVEPESQHETIDSSPQLDFTLNLPIARGKVIRLYTQHPLHNCISYTKLSSSFHAFSIPNSVDEALKIPEWKKVTLEEYNALEKNGTWVITKLLLEEINVGCRIRDQRLGTFKVFLGNGSGMKQQSIFVSQRKYILDLLRETRISGCKPAETPMDPNTRYMTRTDGLAADKG
ncbi:hypothetical protein ZIOFF_005076 [Zingiber officinale]|uniref:Uncharacterized protein n=1 Tax=Zingiber officinale TaxID=94328 RepID=A0A8J5HTP4_ZINOF|nr:hypothetical protein ZIOFF_005076 [Zingiber officinale]